MCCAIYIYIVSLIQNLNSPVLDACFERYTETAGHRMFRFATVSHKKKQSPL